jgi:hypothetical protein
MAVERTLEMVFATDLNRRYTLRVNDAREDVTPAEVNAAMTTIISSNIINGDAGQLTGKVSARLVNRESSDLDLS